jgi:predicted DNA-binding transcriptional regulator AlpA
MSGLHTEQRVRAQRAIDTQRALYRNELRRAAADRVAALAGADAATRRIAQLLPGAVQAGLTIVEVAELTEISRPTIYRMLSDARHAQDLRGLAQQLQDVVAQASSELSRPALPADLATSLQVSLDEVQTMLGQVFGYLATELDGLGPNALTTLVDLLPELGKPEKIILNMVFLQRLPTDDVARSTKFPQTEVLAWAALGLLRLLPELRRHSPAGVY